MRFQILDIIPHRVNPVTGRFVAAADRLEQTLLTARRAEQLGFDAFAVGERHAGHFLSSSPTVLLGAIAAETNRIRLNTGVTVLSILDRWGLEAEAIETSQINPPGLPKKQS